MKITALNNITLIETSVLALYLLVHYLIFNVPLLCTSCGDSKICLPPIYILVEFFPDDQITPKLFSSLNSTIIYISSSKLLLNRSIPMEVRFNTFPLSCVNKEFSIQFLIIFKIIFLSRAIAHIKIFSRECPSKSSIEPEHAKTSQLYQVLLHLL